MMSESKYCAELNELWRAAVDPRGVGMVEAIAAELAAYTGEPIPVVLECMASGTDEFKQLWNASRIDPKDSVAVAAFYRDQFVEAYELADWHCGRANGYVPLSYAHATHLARSKRRTRALDFGSGIGTGALCLLQVGCEVDCADVATGLLRFVRHRVEQRGLHVGIIDLSAGEKPKTAHYDLITCFDVLEHIPDPYAKLIELQGYLRPGGYLVVNLMHNSSDPDRPMHVSSAPNWLPMIRQTRLVPDWSQFFEGTDGPVQAFVYRRLGRVRNGLGASVDYCQRLAGLDTSNRATRASQG